MTVLAALFNATEVFSESRVVQVVSEQMRHELQDFPTESVVVWGGVFPYEAVYPVLKQTESAFTYKLYGLGVFVHAPFSRSYAEQIAGTGMVDRLTSQSGVPIVANKQRFGFLSIYCEKRLNGLLRELNNNQYGQLHVIRQRCETTVPK
jgi:hypothetical protein